MLRIIDSIINEVHLLGVGGWMIKLLCEVIPFVWVYKILLLSFFSPKLLFMFKCE